MRPRRVLRISDRAFLLPSRCARRSWRCWVRCRHERIGVPMDQLPVVAFLAEHLGDPQVERYRLGMPPHAHAGALNPNPVGDRATRAHVQDVELTVAAWLEGRRVLLVPGPYRIGAVEIV